MSTNTTSTSKDVLVRALREVKDMKQKLAAVQRERNEPIAVIGLACRFPGDAGTPDDYWRLLRGGVNGVSEIPPDRWDIEALYDPNPEVPGKMISKMGGFIGDVDGFDPAFFGIAPREVANMDPQHRLALEVSWEALEQAGLTAAQLLDSETGVFLGIATNDYAHLLLTESGLEEIDAYSLTGNSPNVAAGRIAYVLGLQGPTIAIDTACSSSLVAVHLACQSLRNQECGAALAGGVNLILSPVNTIAFSRMNAMAPDGICKTFDAAADGYVRGEGCGMIVLKRLSDAVADGDKVLALIRGSAVNQDGRSSGLTVPNGPAQQSVIRRALQQAGVSPGEVGYVEAHGTGTPLGDPIELQSLGAVYGQDRDPETPLLIGSVKTNFGHLETAAGVAGLIKIILSLRHGEIPPHLHFQKPTHRVDWSRLPLSVPTAVIDWQPINGRRLAGVSSFGFSGTNAHIILEDSAGIEGHGEMGTQRRGESPPHLFTLSAKSETQLKEMAARMVDYLEQKDAPSREGPSRERPSLEAICYTSHVRRSHWHWRLAVVAASQDDLRQKLAAYAAGEASQNWRTPQDWVVGNFRPGSQPRVTFLFSGQGGQRAGMAAELYQTQPIFRHAFDECAQAFSRYLTRPLPELCFHEGVAGEPFDNQVTAQVALFALQYSLSRLWQAWGIEPAIVMGQSMGEFAAAVTAGVFDLETAAELVAERAHLMMAQPIDGAMGVIMATPTAVTERLERYNGRVWLAGQNTPHEVIVSGHAAAVSQLLAECQVAGIKVRTLRAFARAAVAVHTPLMQPVMDALAPRLAQAKRQRPSLDYISSYTGQLADEALTTVDYWLAQSQQPFNLYAAVNSWLEQDSTLAVEIGPSSGTLGVARRCAPDVAVHWLPSMREKEGENQQMVTTLATLYANGIDVDWRAFHGDRRYLPVDLPSTPFQRERYWLSKGSGDAATRGLSRSYRDDAQYKPAGLRLLGERLPSPLAAVQFAAAWDAHTFDFLRDHQVHNVVVVAGAAHLLRLLTGAQALYGPGPILIKDVLFARPLILSTDEARHIQLIFQPDSLLESHFQIASTAVEQPPASWTEHVTGQVAQEMETAPLVNMAPLETVRARCRKEMTAADFYEGLEERNYLLGPTFRWLEAIWCGDGEAVAQVRTPLDEDFLIPPGLLDACLQLLTATGPTKGLPTYVPYAIDQLRFYGRPAGPLHCYAVRRPHEGGGRTVVGDICLFDEAGGRVLEVAGLRARPITAEDLRRELNTQAPADDNLFFEIQWQPQAAPLPLPDAPSDGRWLIFADTMGVGDALAAAWPDAWLVRSGDAYQRVSAAQWQIRPGAAADYEQIVADIASTDTVVAGILHLWSLNSGEQPAADDGLAEQIWGCDSLLLLLQALTRNPALQGRLYGVTAAAQSVGDPISNYPPPLHATLWGLGVVAANEHPDQWGGLIDLPWTSPTAMAEMLKQEALIHDAEQRVAWRAGLRYVARLEKSRLVEVASLLPFPQGAYLLTGGLGVLGLRVAGWLAAQGVRHLVLLGRRAPDDMAQSQIDALQQQGIEVVIRQVDVADMEALTAVFDEIQAAMPPLRGVFHLAGILDDAILMQETAEHMHKVMAPKVQGAWNLHRLTETAALDSFVLFSSAAAVLGGPGQGAYAAANAAMDGLAHYRRAHGLAATSLNWGPWREGGLADSDTADQARWQAWGMQAMDPADGLRYLEIALSRPWTQVMIAPWDLTAVAGQKAALSPFFSSLIKESAPPTAVQDEVMARWRAQLAQTTPTQRRPILIKQLQEQARRILRLPATMTLDEDQPLHELGLDSLMAVELRNALVQLTGERLPVTLLFDYPSLGEMADHLLGQLRHVESTTPPEASEETSTDKLAAEIEALSEEEAIARLTESLNMMKEG